MKYEGTDMGITASYRASAELFATHHDRNHVSQDLSLETDFSRMLGAILPKESTVHVRELLLYTPILPDFQSLVTPSPDATTGGVGTPRTNTLRNVFDMDWSMPFSILTKMTLGYKNTDTQYQDPALIDGQENEARISFSHDLSRTDTATTGYSYRQFNPSGGEITHFHTVAVGDRHAFSATLTGEAGLGLIAVVLPELDKPQYSMQANLSLSKQFRDSVRWAGALTRDIVAGSGVTDTVMVHDAGTMSVSQKLTQALSIDANLNVARNYSMPGLKTIGSPVDIHSYGTGMGLHYDITSWLRSDLEYRYYRQETAGAFQADLTRSQYGFSITAKWS
jgi:hypothetical protein